MRDKMIWLAGMPRDVDYFLLASGLCFILVFMLWLPPQRVGDGSEYYAMYLAWKETLRPFMTEKSFQAYADCMASGQVPGLVSRAQLEGHFPALRLGTTADFNHFWLFSFLAFVIGRIAALLHIGIQMHTGFVLLHFLLLATVILIAHRFYRWIGVVTVLVLTFGSPIFWFIDKVHTEFFTYCLVLSSIILLTQRQFIVAALFQALASTQNPSFAIIAAFCLLLGLVSEPRRLYGKLDVILIGCTGLLILLHPAYYFFRFGVPTPQLLAGGASLGGNLSTFYIWLFDPDVGLLPNWPIGALGLLMAFVLALLPVTRPVWSRQAGYVAAFLVFYLLVNLYAHSSTTNINSGATPGLSRYALWYLPLAFPIFIYVTSATWYRPAVALPMALLLSGLGLFSMYQNVPIRRESYTTPAPLSLFIQSRLPWLYNPPDEVFAERYTPFGEGVHLRKLLAIVGPDCRKMLVIPASDRQSVYAPPECFMTAELQDIAARYRQSMRRIGYVTLTNAEFAAARGSLEVGRRYRVGADRPGNFVLRTGWSGLEPWGVWSNGSPAVLAMPCDDGRTIKSVVLEFRVFERQSIAVKGLDGRMLWQGAVEGAEASLEFPFDQMQCRSGQALVSIDISNPTSPSERGMSNDRRKLGIGLSAVTFTE